MKSPPQIIFATEKKSGPGKSMTSTRLLQRHLVFPDDHFCKQVVLKQIFSGPIFAFRSVWHHFLRLTVFVSSKNCSKEFCALCIVIHMTCFCSISNCIWITLLDDVKSIQYRTNRNQICGFSNNFLGVLRKRKRQSVNQVFQTIYSSFQKGKSTTKVLHGLCLFNIFSWSKSTVGLKIC